MPLLRSSVFQVVSFSQILLPKSLYVNDSKSRVFWNVTLCLWVSISRRFEDTTILWNVGEDRFQQYRRENLLCEHVSHVW